MQRNEQRFYFADKDKIDAITDLYRINIRLDAKNLSMKKAGEIADNVIAEFEELEEELKALHKPVFSKRDDNILIVNKATKETRTSFIS